MALQAATKSQIDLLSREIAGQQTLLDQGLTQVTRVLTPQRELARLEGVAGQVEASIAENRGKIAEIEIQRVRLVSKAREDAIAELRELEFQEIETREKRRQILDRMARLYLRAPVSGTVYDSTADTVRAVIRSAEPVMYVVPKDTPLIVRTRIDTIHIDQVHVGQEAILRFSAFDQRTTPELQRPRHRRVGRRLFRRAHRAALLQGRHRARRQGGREARPRDAPARDAGRVVHPAPATRSALSYFVKPMEDYFTRAFRDE